MQALIKDVTDVHKTLLVVAGVTLWQPHPGETQRRVMVPYGIKWFKSVHGDAALTNHRSVLKLLASSGSSLLVQEFCPWWCCHSEAPICYQAPGFIYIYIFIYCVYLFCVATQINLWWMILSIRITRRKFFFLTRRVWVSLYTPQLISGFTEHLTSPTNI